MSYEDYLYHKESKQLQDLSSVPTAPLRWAWQDRVPIGHVTFVDGRPDIGKSTVLADLAARVSGANNGLMPDGTLACDGMPRGVVLFASEEGSLSRIKSRFLAMHGSIEFLACPMSAERYKTFDFFSPVGLTGLQEHMERINPALVIFDPFLDWFPKNSIAKATELATLADRLDVAIVCVRHLKGTRSAAIYRGMGPVSLTGVARSVLLVAQDPDDEGLRHLAVVKSNLAPKAPTLAFRLKPRSVLTDEIDCDGYGDPLRVPSSVCVVEWQGTSPYSADDLTDRLQRKAARSTEAGSPTLVVAAKTLLWQLTATHGVACDVAFAEGAKLGLSKRCMERARTALRLQTTHRQEGGVRRYYWSRPRGGEVAK